MTTTISKILLIKNYHELSLKLEPYLNIKQIFPNPEDIDISFFTMFFNLYFSNNISYYEPIKQIIVMQGLNVCEDDIVKIVEICTPFIDFIKNDC